MAANCSDIELSIIACQDYRSLSAEAILRILTGIWNCSCNSLSTSSRIRHSVPLDFSHLQLRTSEFTRFELTRELFFEKLRERLATADIDMVKQDVEPFIIDKRELDIWSNDYFLHLADMIKFL